MKRIALGLGVALALFVAGCSSASQQIVGTWKGELVPPATQTDSKNKSDIGEAFANGLKGMLNSFIGPLTLEFNADGKYKASVNLGSATGAYKVSGNEVILTPDKPDDNKNNLKLGTFEISSDGKSIHSKKEFASDTVIELKKQ